MTAILKGHWKRQTMKDNLQGYLSIPHKRNNLDQNIGSCDVKTELTLSSFLKENCFVLSDPGFEEQVKGWVKDDLNILTYITWKIKLPLAKM